MAAGGLAAHTVEVVSTGHRTFGNRAAAPEGSPRRMSFV